MNLRKLRKKLNKAAKTKETTTTIQKSKPKFDMFRPTSRDFKKKYREKEFY